MPRAGSYAVLVAGGLAACGAGGARAPGAGVTNAASGARSTDRVSAAATGSTRPAGELPVAEVDGRPIYADQIAAQAAAAQSDARAALDALIDAELLAAEAQRRYASPSSPSPSADPELDEAAKAERVRRYLATTFEKDADSSLVPEAELRDTYQHNIGFFDHPPLVKVRHILAMIHTGDDTARRAVLRQRADEVAARARLLRDPEAFTALAATLSDERVQLVTEALVTGGPGTHWTVEPFARASFALAAVGDVSGVVETRFGYHVLMLEEKLPEQHMSFEDARAHLREDLWPKVRAREFGKFVDALVEKHAVTVAPGLLGDEPVVPPATTEPAAGSAAP